MVARERVDLRALLIVKCVRSPRYSLLVNTVHARGDGVIALW